MSEQNIIITNKSYQLIVDFPEMGRQAVLSDIGNASTNCAPRREQRRNVRFSELSTLAFIEYPTKESNAKKWISTEDRKSSRQAQLSDVLKTRSLIESKPRESLSQEEILQCIGIESLLTNKVLKKTCEKRRMHRQAILAEQQRQQPLHIHDAENLCQISEIHSQWSREKAHKIAVGYSRMGEN